MNNGKHLPPEEDPNRRYLHAAETITEQEAETIFKACPWCDVIVMPGGMTINRQILKPSK